MRLDGQGPGDGKIGPGGPNGLMDPVGPMGPDGPMGPGGPMNQCGHGGLLEPGGPLGPGELMGPDGSIVPVPRGSPGRGIMGVQPPPYPGTPVSGPPLSTPVLGKKSPGGGSNAGHGMPGMPGKKNLTSWTLYFFSVAVLLVVLCSSVEN